MKKLHSIPLVFAFVALFAFSLPVAAAATIVVTPTNQQGWSTADTQSDGMVTFVADPTAPSGVGALQLTTDAKPASKAQYMHETNTALGAVTELSYWTKQVSASFPAGDPAYLLPVLLNGTSGFATLVFEPYYNTQQGPVLTNTWQQWDVDAGLFWSSRTVQCANGTLAGSPGGPAAYTLAAIQSLCPNAVVTGFGVNVGTNNPSYVVRTDLVDFNGTTYDFEPYQEATDKDQCKNGGWQNVRTAEGQPFKNQGDCVSYAATGGKH